MTDQQTERVEALADTIAFAGEAVRIEDTNYQGIIEDITFDEIEVAGGNAESGGFVAVIPIGDFTDRPEKLDEIEAHGKTLQILSIVDRNGVSYAITAGDPVSDDA